ncbi:hypothetical protein B0J13DRAFT_621274 [Dactylonectria estremocensis]|uniref:G-patch domain-containing protein n=1 Tax=Dactylonectria estremocensis TaxID=1079267 RepID=A0A9P9F0C4_9HYPO|nr:hypothetical protein B0J13DRAFT_621274 [Dactylonectria estremocensis]
MTAPPPPPRGGLSLYENLLDPNDSSSSATISSAPVLYNQAESASAEPSAKKPVDPALRFQPIRRPQPKQSKPKLSFPKPAGPKPVANVLTAPAPPKSTLADWAATEDDEWQYGAVEKRQRGGRKKKKKQQMHLETDWEELYDPARPTNVEEYLRSDEKVNEVREWKALLYRHRKKRVESDFSEDEDGDTRHVASSQFAPPPSYSFVPPPPESLPAPAPPPDSTDEDAFANRVPMSHGQAAPTHPAPPSNPTTISRAPVRYAQPDETRGDDDSEPYSPPPTIGGPSADVDSQARSTRPGQAGFAHRLMSKYGWTKGTGLGADETGIINPLRVQVEKRRKKADADGGGWAEPGSKGKIVGGNRKEGSTGKFGTMSEVIVLQNMLENLPDLEVEIADGLGQEIGEECGEKYGRVERLYIESSSRQVFIKFTNQVSALRAVNELDGRVFNGNAIVPKFYDTDKFEKGIYN